MRVLILSNYYPPKSIGSYELQCFQVCHELVNRGHQIQILTSEPPPEGHGHYPETKVFRELKLYDEETGTRHRNFNQLFRLVRFNRNVLERHLIHFIPEVIMVWGMDRLPTSLLQLAEASGIPCLYAVYDHWLGEACTRDRWLDYWNGENGSDPPVFRNFLRSLRLDRFVQKRAASGELTDLRFENIYFCSESLKKETMRSCELPPLEKALVIPCAIAPRDIRRKEGQVAQNFRLIYIARLSEDKDPMTALRALQELRHRGDERFTLDLYGRGRMDYESTLHDYVRRYQLGGSVSFKPMSEEQVRNNIHLYDALIFTSKFPEPFPLVHLKAMAAGVPVISTLEGGSSELIRDGENGLTFATANQYELADRISQIADDPALVERLVRTAYSDVTQHYTLARITSRIETLLHRAAQTEGALEQAV